VIWSSFVLAVGGWAVSGWAWWYFGVAAGVRPSFIMALSVGVAFTATFAIAFVMPDSQRIYALGVREGIRLGSERCTPGPHKLELVQR
jgi:hypothetical protein